MTSNDQPKVAIVDYSLGNLFSVKNACACVGLDAFITADKDALFDADAVILPGVGAFGDAMENLRRLDLVAPLRDIAQSDKTLLGICLGQQLLMSESHEFGRHDGLNIITGEVVRFTDPMGVNGPLKVPQVGWNRIYPPKESMARWQGTPLAETRDGEFMYFVHSYYVKPVDPAVVLTVTQYGQTEFCSAIHKDNVTAFQFHPERSSVDGMRIYQCFAENLYHKCSGSRPTSGKEVRHAA